MFSYGHIEAVNREQHQDRLRRAEKQSLIEQAAAGRDRFGLRQVIKKFSANTGQQAAPQGKINRPDLANRAA